MGLSKRTVSPDLGAHLQRDGSTAQDQELHRDHDDACRKCGTEEHHVRMPHGSLHVALRAENAPRALNRNRNANGKLDELAHALSLNRGPACDKRVTHTERAGDGVSVAIRSATDFSRKWALNGKGRLD